MPISPVFTLARSAPRSLACWFVANRTWPIARLAISFSFATEPCLRKGSISAALQLAFGTYPLPSHGAESSPAQGPDFGLFSVSLNGILAYAGGGYVEVQPTLYDRNGKYLVRSASPRRMAP